ncbi:MAG: preQ(1) synthase [Phycisphaerales bacterium]
MPDASLLEAFPTPDQAGDHPFLIEHFAEEFTSLCPKTGHPDFGTITIRYVPRPASQAGNQGCVELKSLKLYLQSFRTQGIFYEAVTNEIRNDLAQLMNPLWLEVTSDWKGRGGIRSRITASLGQRPNIL